MDEREYQNLESQILTWDREVKEGAVFPITAEAVSKAMAIVKNLEATTKDDLLLHLAALNLLNAAIKLDAYKSKVSRVFVKNRAVSLISKVKDLKDKGVTYYYNTENEILYFKFESVVYGFHVADNKKPEILMASFAEPILWPGIRLQPISQRIFGMVLAELNPSLPEEVSANEQKDSNSDILLEQMLDETDGSEYSYMLEGCKVGDAIEISAYGVTKKGWIDAFNNNYLLLELGNGNLVRVKYDSIMTVELNPEMDQSFNVHQVLKRFNETVNNLGLNPSALIETNATITMVDSKRIWMISDDGTTNFYCYKNNIIGNTANKLVKGQRVYLPVNKEGLAYFVALETTYDDFFENTRRLITSAAESPGRYRSHILVSLTCLKNWANQETPAWDELCQLRKELKSSLPQEQKKATAAQATNAAASAALDDTPVVAPEVPTSDPESTPAPVAEHPADETNVETEVTEAVSDTPTNAEPKMPAEEPADDNDPVDTTADAPTNKPTDGIYRPEDTSMAMPKIVGKIDLDAIKSNRPVKSTTSSLTITLDDIDEQIITPPMGEVKALLDRHGYIKRYDGQISNDPNRKDLYFPVDQLISWNGILDKPRRNDPVIFSVGKNWKGETATCVLKVCSIAQLEDLIEKYNYDSTIQRLLNEHLKSIEPLRNQAEDYTSVIAEMLKVVGIPSDEPFSPENVEKCWAEKLMPIEYKRAMDALIDWVLMIKPGLSYDLFTRANSYAVSHRMFDWSASILERALKTYSHDDNKLGYFDNLYDTTKSLKQRIPITEETLQQAIDINSDINERISKYAIDSLRSYMGFEGFIPDKQTTRTGLYDVRYIDEVRENLERDPGNDQMYLTLIKLELSFHPDTYDPSADIRNYLAKRAERYIAQGYYEKFDEVRYLLRQSFMGQAIDDGTNLALSLFMLTLLDRRDLLDQIINGEYKDYQFRNYLKEVIENIDDSIDLELGYLAACNAELATIIDGTAASLDASLKTPQIFAAEYQELKNLFAQFQDSPLKKFNSLVGFLREARIVMPRERENVELIANNLMPRLTDFSTGETRYSKLRESYNEIVTLINGELKRLGGSATMIRYEFLAPALNILKEAITDEFEAIQSKLDPKLSVELIDDSVNILKDNVVNVNVIIRSVENSSRDIFINDLQVEGPDLEESNTLSISKKLGAGEEIPVALALDLHDTILKGGVAEATFTLHYDDTFAPTDRSSERINKKDFAVAKKITIRKEQFKAIPNKYDIRELDAGDSMFFGRSELLGNLKRTILGNWNTQIAIYGQKRSGKSSLLNQLSGILEKEGSVLCAEKLNVSEGKPDSEPFENWLLFQIAKKLARGSKSSVTISELKEFFKNPDPFEALKEFILHLRSMESLADKHFVVFIDEFTYIYQLTKDGNMSEDFMRRWKALVETPGVMLQTVIAAQDTLPDFMKESYAANAFGIFNLEPLSYLSKDEALKLVVEPIPEVHYHGRSDELIVENTAGSAFFTQMVCHNLIELLNAKETSIVTREEVDTVINNMCASIEHRVEGSTFECLIHEGDGSDFSDNDNQRVLKALAVATRAGGAAKSSELETNLETQQVERILQHLYDRRVVSKNEDSAYSINVKLFKKWMLRQ